MKLGTRGRYAVMAMADLASCCAGAPVTLACIADRQDLSLSYLEQLFSCLRKGKLVDSVRGPGGGYKLTRPLSEIKISDIVMAVDEPLRATMCKPGGKPCRKDNTKCATHDLWEELGQQIYFFLDAISLEDVVQQRVSGFARRLPDCMIQSAEFTTEQASNPSSESSHAAE